MDVSFVSRRSLPYCCYLSQREELAAVNISARRTLTFLSFYSFLPTSLFKSPFQPVSAVAEDYILLLDIWHSFFLFLPRDTTAISFSPSSPLLVTNITSFYVFFFFFFSEQLTHDFLDVIHSFIFPLFYLFFIYFLF